MNQEIQKAPETSYYSERYSEACGKMIEKILSELDYKNLVKYFNAKTLSRYDEERFKSFCKQFTEYFRNALKVLNVFINF